MAKTAFVTGATGCVGLNLIEELLEQGWRVTAMHRVGSDLSQLQRHAVRGVRGDVTDASSLDKIIPRNVDCVFHVAGNTSLWSRSHAEQLSVNVEGTRNVVNASVAAGARRFILTSSIVAYGSHGGTISEDTPTRGTAARINYIRSKALAEREVRHALHKGLPAVIINPSNILGAYDTKNWARMFRLVKDRRLPVVPSGGGSFCHVREVARAHIAAAEQGRIGANYLLGGAETSYLGLVKEISQMLGVKRYPKVLPKGMLHSYAFLEEMLAPVFGREPEVTRDAVELLSQNIYCDTRRAVRELGYKPQPMDVMLKDSMNWMLEQGLLTRASLLH
ncbi:MAG: NAD-dependent epimerase/dehydratase family protein [Pseudomonadota bacterium]